jgi:hypothetical protein
MSGQSLIAVLADCAMRLHSVADEASAWYRDALREHAKAMDAAVTVAAGLELHARALVESVEFRIDDRCAALLDALKRSLADCEDVKP